MSNPELRRLSDIKFSLWHVVFDPHPSFKKIRPYFLGHVDFMQNFFMLFGFRGHHIRVNLIKKHKHSLKNMILFEIYTPAILNLIL